MSDYETVIQSEQKSIIMLLSIEKFIMAAKAGWFLSPFIKIKKKNLRALVHLFCTVHFCLQPSAKDQGITWVVVLLGLVHHLVHFLFKINLSEKKFSLPGNQTGVLLLPSRALSTELRLNWYKLMENYLFKQRISKTTPQTLRQSWCNYLFMLRVAAGSSPNFENNVAHSGLTLKAWAQFGLKKLRLFPNCSIIENSGVTFSLIRNLTTSRSTGWSFGAAFLAAVGFFWNQGTSYFFAAGKNFSSWKTRLELSPNWMNLVWAELLTCSTHEGESSNWVILVLDKCGF